MPAELDAAAAELAAQQALARLGLLDGELRRPLERRVRLGEKVETLAVTASRPFAARFTRPASSAMPRTSSSVSLGRPIMK